MKASLILISVSPEQTLIVRDQRTFRELAILRAFSALPNRPICVLEVVSTCVCVIADAFHALRQAVIILQVGQRVSAKAVVLLFSSDAPHHTVSSVP